MRRIGILLLIVSCPNQSFGNVFVYVGAFCAWLGWESHASSSTWAMVGTVHEQLACAYKISNRRRSFWGSGKTLATWYLAHGTCGVHLRAATGTRKVLCRQNEQSAIQIGGPFRCSWFRVDQDVQACEIAQTYSRLWQLRRGQVRKAVSWNPVLTERRLLQRKAVSQYPVLTGRRSLQRKAVSGTTRCEVYMYFDQFYNAKLFRGTMDAWPLMAKRPEDSARCTICTK